MNTEREQTIQRFMQVVGMPRAVAEEAVDEIDNYVRHWSEQLIEHHKKHHDPSEEEMPRWLVEQKRKQNGAE